MVLLIGSEVWLKEEVVQHLKAQCLSPGFEAMDFVRFDSPPETPILLEAIQTLPFGSPLRLVVVEVGETISPETVPWALAYLAHPNPRGCVVLCGEQLEKERFLGAAKIVWCTPLKGEELKRWITGRAKQEGKAIEPDAMVCLISRLGTGLHPLALALESLALLVGGSARIQKSDVERLVAPSVKETAFHILDHAASGQVARAFGLLRQSLAQGALTIEQMVGALGWYYRMVWKARFHPTTDSWVSPSRQAALDRLARTPVPQLWAALEEVLERDKELKLGIPAPELMANRLLLKLGRLGETP